jgi:hypothetical protein
VSPRILFIAAALISIFVVIVFRKSGSFKRIRETDSALPLHFPRATNSMIYSIAWCLVAPTAVMAVFVGLCGSTNDKLGQLLSADHHRPDSPGLNQHKPANVSDEAIPHEVPGSTNNRPQWITDTDSTSGEVRRVVLSSRLWSTEDEAMNELRPKVAALVKADFDERHSGLTDPNGRQFISVSRLEEVTVKERYVERTNQNFGNFSSSMTRVWWQVEISPVVRTELYGRWKTATIENRMLVVGTGLALLVLLANARFLYATLRRAFGSGKTHAIAVTVSCMMFWMSVGVSIAAFFWN